MVYNCSNRPYSIKYYQQHINKNKTHPTATDICNAQVKIYSSLNNIEYENYLFIINNLKPTELKKANDKALNYVCEKIIDNSSPNEVKTIYELLL